jgi:osmoprotectant transport system permease protein
VLALVVDQLLGLIEAGAARRDPRRVLVGAIALIAGVAAALAPLAGSALAPQTGYVVGAKNFSEQFILASIIGERLARHGAKVDHKDGLGSAVIFRALASSDIDVYVDYSGTLWTNVMGRKDSPPREQMLAELTRSMKARYGVVVLGPLGFENAYALAMKSDRAAQLGIRSIDDLAAHAPELTLGADLEFLSRPEWTAIRDAYGLKFKAQKSFNPTFMYRALEDGEADVISAFSSDGRIAAQHLTVLSDPRHAIPAYDAVVLISPRRAEDPRLRRALEPMIGKIPVEQMRQANLMVDGKGASPGQAAHWLERATGISP